MSHSNEGNTYRQRYKAYAYPHVAIIDPRTGRLLWKKEGWTQQNPMTPEEFVQAASDFCSRHSFDREPMAPRIGNQGISSLQAAAASGAATAMRTSQEMTEEEQLQAAIQASMHDDIDQQATYDDDDEDSYIMEDDDDNEEDMGEGDLEDSKPAAAVNVEEEKEELSTNIVNTDDNHNDFDIDISCIYINENKDDGIVYDCQSSNFTSLILNDDSSCNIDWLHIHWIQEDIIDPEFQKGAIWDRRGNLVRC